jgi:glyoxylase-like metal-dependent hydrolase (beta-lactamase superfamily II)
VVVLRSGRRTVVLNTGMPADFGAFNSFVQTWHNSCRIYRDEQESTEAVLAGAGVDPASVEVVILTPLTIYTTGNLRLFPKAKFAMSRRGWVAFWAPEPHEPRLPLEIAMPRESRFYLADEAFDRIQLLSDEETICPGIGCFWTGGHHVSSMAITVDTAKGKVILADCFFTYDNLEKNVPIGWAENLHEIYAAYARVRKEADIAVPLYDPEALRRFPGGKVA